MPLAIWVFRAWLFPENQPRWLVTTMPIILVLCYALEIALLWHLLRSDGSLPYPLVPEPRQIRRCIDIGENAVGRDRYLDDAIGVPGDELLGADIAGRCAIISAKVDCSPKDRIAPFGHDARERRSRRVLVKAAISALRSLLVDLRHVAQAGSAPRRNRAAGA